MQGARFNRIASLTCDKTNWRIKVRLTRMWPRINSTTGEFKGLNLILLDDDKTHIHAYAGPEFYNGQDLEPVERRLYEVFGGDFRQILPVVEKDNRQDIVSVINRSYIWDEVKLFTLKQNMRLHKGNSDAIYNAIDEFSKWVLDIGDGRISFIDENDPNRDPDVLIPEKFLIPHNNDPISDIVDFIYPCIECNFKDHQYLRDRAILAPTNKLVDEINAHVLDRIPGEENAYLSVDSIDEGPMDENDLNSAFPVEFLNSIYMSGMPKHELKLKVGVVVMLTRNINQGLGLCNGTRMVIKKLFN